VIDGDSIGQKVKYTIMKRHLNSLLLHQNVSIGPFYTATIGLFTSISVVV